MTPRMLEILKLMAEEPDEEADYDNEIVCDGFQCFLGYQRVSTATVRALLRIMALRETNEGGHCRRYSINSVGQALIARPEVEDEIRAALAAGGSWTVKENRMVRMP